MWQFRFIRKEKFKTLTIVAMATLLVLVWPTETSAFGFKTLGDTVADVLLFMPGWLSILMLQILSLILYLAGTILNFVLNHTVINMAQNIDTIGIDMIWGTIRDLANMAFIFILLYAAIQTILGIGPNVKELIVKVITVAILINFSLFATKAVIDASNILAIYLYDAAASGVRSASGDMIINKGLANSIMQPLGLQTLAADVGLLDGTKAITVGIMGSIFVLIAAFVLFAMSILFVIRYVVLIFVLVLSPIAFIAYVLPALKTHANKWKDALIGQAFFAPIFFLLMWVVINLSRGVSAQLGSHAGGKLSSAILGTASTTVSSTETAAQAVGTLGVGTPISADIGLIVNFMIIIALLIGALITSKEWANKAGPIATKMTKWATGQAGKATFGVAGFAGRRTIGAAGVALGDSEALKKMASNENSAVQRFAGRWALKGGRAVGRQSFDVRGTGLGGELDAGKPGGKGGFAKYQEEKAKEEAKFAASLKPSDRTIKQAEDELEEAKKIDETTAAFGSEHKRVAAEQMRAARDKKEKLSVAEGEYADYATQVRNGLKVDPVEVKRLKEKIAAARKEYEEADNKSKAINTRRGYKQSKIDAAQAKVDNLKGVKPEDIVRMKKEKIDQNTDTEAAKKAGERLSREEARQRSVEAKITERQKKLEEERKGIEDRIVERQKTLEDEIENDPEIKEFNTLKKEIEEGGHSLNSLMRDRLEELQVKADKKRSSLETIAKADIDSLNTSLTSMETAAKSELDSLDIELKSSQQRARRLESESKQAQKKAEQAKEKIEKEFEERQKSGSFDSASDRRKRNFANITENSVWARIAGYNEAAAASIRKGKSDEEQFTELAKKIAKKEEEAKKKEEKEEKPEEKKP